MPQGSECWNAVSSKYFKIIHCKDRIRNEDNRAELEVKDIKWNYFNLQKTMVESSAKDDRGLTAESHS